MSSFRAAASATRVSWWAALLVTAFVLLSTRSSAQLSMLGTAQLGVNQLVNGVDGGYDPDNDAYLLVGANNHVTGVWVNHSGVPISGLSPVVIKSKSVSGSCSSSSKPYGAFPRVRYSPELGGFLVAWSEEEHTCAGGTVRVYMRTVKYPNVLGPVTKIADATAHLSYGNLAIGYSPTSQRFLVAFQTLGPARVRVQLVNLNGGLIGGSVRVSEDRYAASPSVAWNPNTNEFGVGYSGEVGNGASFFSGFVRVPATNAAAFSRTIFNNPASSRTQVTDMSFNPTTNRFVMTWWEPQKARAAEIDAAGVVKTLGTASTVIGRNSYDSLSAAFNPSSGTILLVGAISGDDDVGGAELNGRGVRISSEMTLVPSPDNQPARYIRVTARTDASQWVVPFSRAFLSLRQQALFTISTGGGSNTAHPAPGTSTPPPPPPPPPPSGGGGGGGTTGCTGSAPVSGWVCIGNNSWVPPDHPLAGGGGTTTPPPPPPPPPPSGTCTNSPPVSGWVCIGNNSWVPPDHPLAAGGSSGGGSTGGGTTGGCTTPSPGTGWVCSGGNWFPPDHPGAGLPICSSSAGAPASGWVKVNGGWVPPDHPLASTGTCKAA
jgi:hypothetical protein